MTLLKNILRCISKLANKVFTKKNNIAKEPYFIYGELDLHWGYINWVSLNGGDVWHQQETDKWFFRVWLQK